MRTEDDHLDDAQVAAALAGGELEPAARHHLDACLLCRRELDGLAAAVAARRRDLAAALPDLDEQREGVLARLGEEREGRRRRGWLWALLASAAALLLAVGLGLVRPPAQQPPAEHDLAVEQILAETDALLDDHSIPGFDAIDPGLETLTGHLPDSTS